MSKPINIVDLFAGPGGLGEGFSSCRANNQQAFNIRISVEKEASAHKTLTLRAFYRKLASKKQRSFYHDYVAGNISKSDMISSSRREWEEAEEETLGMPTALGEDNARIHERLKQLKGARPSEHWVVIGGPPCQAYSLAGRSRNMGIEGYKAENDHRHYLYQEYLKVLDIIQPDVFVMENVKGILTSRVDGERIFPKIRSDLEHPTATVLGKNTKRGKRYKLYSLVVPPDDLTLLGPKYLLDSSYIIKAENYGIPQARHRVILLGISEEKDIEPCLLKESPPIIIESIIGDLPPIRSKLSKGRDSHDAWASTVKKQAARVNAEIRSDRKLRMVGKHMLVAAQSLDPSLPTEADEYSERSLLETSEDSELAKWLLYDRPHSLLNHESRGHIPDDLGRYLFCSSWAEVFSNDTNNTPKAKDFPSTLRPNHLNWESGNFADRFRVQARGRPATTITSHISKDGHYYIHFDSKQCRSLTVREAARIQTFPDNYMFEGNRTQQYVQVGNAVPPFLARKIGEIVIKLFS